MKKFLSIFNIENLKINLEKIISRFPLSVIIVFIVSILFFINLHWNLIESSSEKVFKIIFCFIIVFFFGLWVYISWENNNFPKLKKNLLQFIPIGFWILLYNVFSNDLNDFENILFIILSSAGILFYLFFAPYIKNIIENRVDQNIFYTYFYNISVLFLMSFILWLLLFILWSIWISAVFELFDIQKYFTVDIYQDWAIISLSFITPIFALTQVPDTKSFNNNYFNENAFFSFIIKYIIIPFIYIYFIILYAYSIKVLVNFGDWPKGEVSWMVIWFSVLWYIAYIFSYIFEEKNKFIKTFRTAFPFVVIPQIFMLFYAIYLRINQYDITVNRYFVVVFGLWLLTISIYYIFSKKKSLSIIPFLLTIFTIIISVWPWSVHQLPQTRQLTRLKNNLTTAWILVNNEIKPLNNYTDIDKYLSENIYSWITYLCDFKNCDSIKNLFPIFYFEILKTDQEKFDLQKQEDLKRYEKDSLLLKQTQEKIYKWPYKWDIVDKITSKIKVKGYYWTADEKLIPNLTFSIDIQKEDLFPINISWYKEILKINDKLNFNKGTNINNNWDFANVNVENATLEIIRNWVTVETINIQEIIDKLLWKYVWWIDNFLPKNDLIFDITSNNKSYKILFENISIKNPQYTWLDKGYYYTNWYVLVK